MEMLQILPHPVGRDFYLVKYSPHSLEHLFRDTFVWELYNEITEKSDLKRVDDWNALADTMLLFVRRIFHAQSVIYSMIGCLVRILSFCVLDHHNGKSQTGHWRLDCGAPDTHIQSAQ